MKSMKIAFLPDEECSRVEKPRLCLDHVDQSICKGVGCLWCPQEMNGRDLACIWPDLDELYPK